MKRLVMILLIVGIVNMIPIATFGDVGNSVDYGGSGKSYSGSSNSGSSYSGSFDFYMIYWIIRLIVQEPLLLLVVVVGGMVYIVMRALKRQSSKGYGEIASSYERGNGGSSGGNNGLSLAVDTASLRRLVEKDPGFSEQLLVSKVNNMFVRLQLAWMNKVWEEVRPFETDALFATHKMQLDQYIANNRTNRVEDICVVNTELLKYYQIGEYDYLDIEIKAKFVDYVVDDKTGKVIKGDSRRKVYMQYKWKLTRKQGTLTNTKHIEATECPNCGANIAINQAGKCEYCGSIVTKGDFDWVLSEIEVVSQH